MYKKWKPDIDSAVTNLCLSIIKEPLLYFSEADIQQLLVEELRKIRQIGETYPTSVRKGKDSKGKYHTSIIHREYGGGGRSRIDVVIFDPDDVAQIDNVNLTRGGKYLKPAFGFELGTEKTQEASGHLEHDLIKLKNRTKDTGYILHFYKDVTQAKTGTLSRQRTEKKLEKHFKNVFMTRESFETPKIKILAILLRTYRNQTKMRGKCEIFNGISWEKVNISRDDSLKKSIMQRLT
jgi:hypothetical protein